MNQVIVVNNGIEKEQESYPGMNIKWLGKNGKLKIYEPLLSDSIADDVVVGSCSWVTKIYNIPFVL